MTSKGRRSAFPPATIVCGAVLVSSRSGAPRGAGFWYADFGSAILGSTSRARRFRRWPKRPARVRFLGIYGCLAAVRHVRRARRRPLGRLLRSSWADREDTVSSEARDNINAQRRIEA
jgi:hypothetical protein